MTSNSVRLSNESIEFLKKFQTNRIRIEVEEKKISYIDALDLIVNFFKLNNDQYVKLAKMKKIKR